MNSLSIAPYIFSEDVYAIKPGVVVVLNNAWDKCREQDIALLSKILISVKQSLAAVQVVVRSSFTESDVASLYAEKIIVFGAGQPNVKLYEVATINNKSILFADSLDALDDQRKKNLWTALKTMFS